MTVERRLRKSKTTATTMNSTMTKGIPVLPISPRPMNLKASGMLCSGSGMAWEMTKVAPRATCIMPRVVMKADRPTRVMKKPLMKPMPAPTSQAHPPRPARCPS